MLGMLLRALGLLLALSGAQAWASDGRRLDDFERPGAWSVVTSDQVLGKLRMADGHQGKALCLDYDFKGVSGYAGLQRELPQDYPDNYAFSFRLRGESPANDLQFKLVDDSGDNVWWVNKTGVVFPSAWTEVVYKKRHITRAWGPSPDPVLRHSRRVEFTIYNRAGGKGSVCFDELSLRPLPPEDHSPLTGSATATADQPGNPAASALDGNAGSAWRAPVSAMPQWQLDLQRQREFGGVVLRWLPGMAATSYRIDLSNDGRSWWPAREVSGADGGNDYIALPESEARHLRLVVAKGEGGVIGLSEFAVQPLPFAATPNDFFKAVAAEAPRGRFPRAFSGEQPYWTIVGVDGGREQGLIGEDGAIELGKGAPSVEPFVYSDGKLVTWAGVKSAQSLQDGYLPIPSVDWTHPDFKLRITAFVAGEPGSSQLVARYRLANTGRVPRKFSLALAVQPFQVNPPSQFLNTIGGVSPIHRLQLVDSRVLIDGKQRVFADHAESALATTFDQGMVSSRLASGDFFVSGEAPQPASVDDPVAAASGALLYPLMLAAGESREISWVAPLEGEFEPQPGFDAAAAQQQVAALWRDKLDRVRLRVPAQGQKVVDTLRTGLAHMLISRIGPRLQPGTRSYSRAWIRDGAMIGEGLLRMGREDVAEEFLRWYAPYQFDNGKVPCCVDDRGSDPVPENDSHCELVFTIAEVYRYTRDRALLESMWPHVQGAVKYMDQLRLSERTEANRARDPAFYGMMPASISHEGYSAKPMHSYWDNFWALRGYKDAVEIAQWLGKSDEAARYAASRDQFRADLYASLDAATKRHGIDYLPGAAELGDFDATSSTIALAPGGEQAKLPQDLLHNTFERYWREFVARRDGTREWKDYTPYELRTIGSFVRLGWREQAHDALAFFFADQQPRAWNQWAEVVSRTPRKPFFVGDLPHAWVESDYVRSALDLFAYTRDDDQALVVAAGLPPAWLDGEGVSVEGLRTPYGALGYSIRRTGNGLQLALSPGLQMPPGGVVLRWPYPQPPGRTSINGKDAKWNNGELLIRAVPARVTVTER
ncbi:discoidin domain-containing protein [Lysobacter niastensis]|uniref:Discoidin domain-containing protein n=1 Tax=Lysobacter niastensis TaxID=380629 RepID=A0ABS0BA45_9GAMM|nr:discoidin domain-containing protein [Lysobacter niastensis]MBF6024514.1 discoidin domain-containing protein [Lysobacter niastensis]